MKMQEHEIFSHFEFEKEKWAVKLELDFSREKTELLAEAVDITQAKVYMTRLTVEKFTEMPELKFMFPSLEELFYYLVHNIKNLKISESAIEFEISMEGFMRKKQFSIELAEKIMSKQDINQIKIKLIESKLEKQLKKKDEEIFYLKNELELQAQRIAQLERSGPSYKEAVQPHNENPDNQCFQFSEGANGLRVKRINHNTWVNFISSYEIREKVTFKVQLNKLTGRCLCLGVGTKSMFGVHNYHEFEFVNYDFECKQIAVNGTKINAESNIRQGSIVTMRCDPKAQRIWWFCDSNEIGSAEFPPQLRNTNLYLIAYFKNSQDELEIWTI